MGIFDGTPKSALQLAHMNDAFGALRDNGGGPRQAPAAMQALQQHQARQKAAEAFKQAQQGGGLPMGFNSPSMQSFAAIYPQKAFAMLAQASVTPEKQPDPWRDYKVVGENVVKAGPDGVRSVYSTPQTAKDRRIVKGADGRNYYADTQEPVLPGVKPGESIDVDGEGKLRKEFTALTGDFRKVRDAMGRIKTASKRDSPAGDLSLIFNYMKMLDPGSVVRESEFRVAANAAPLLERLGISWEKVQSVWAGERLTPDVRTDFITTADGLMSTAQGQYDQTAEEYRNISRQYRFDPSRVVPNLSAPLPPLSDMSNDELDAQIKRARGQ